MEIYELPLYFMKFTADDSSGKSVKKISVSPKFDDIVSLFAKSSGVVKSVCIGVIVSNISSSGTLGVSIEGINELRAWKRAYELEAGNNK